MRQFPRTHHVHNNYVTNNSFSLKKRVMINPSNGPRWNRTGPPKTNNNPVNQIMQRVQNRHKWPSKPRQGKAINPRFSIKSGVLSTCWASPPPPGTQRRHRLTQRAHGAAEWLLERRATRSTERGWIDGRLGDLSLWLLPHITSRLLLYITDGPSDTSANKLQRRNLHFSVCERERERERLAYWTPIG